jgi:mannose-6-phosphate isomerase-like protein (cupin superfamily)
MKSEKDGVFDVEAFKKGNVRLIFFAPRSNDYQTFHDEDEFYFILRGRGELVIENRRFTCGVSDAFFVPANAEHHFENFTKDFATWTIFF